MRSAWIALALAGCAPAHACPTAVLEPPSEPPSYAIVTSDYVTSAIALANDQGELVTEAWIDSGTFAPRLVAALSGDAVLPSAPLSACRIGVIDRLGTDVVTILDPCTSDPERIIRVQIDARGDRPDGTGYRANPQDVLWIDGAYWISRFEPDPGGAVGNDLFVADEHGAAIGRVDLSPFDVEDGEHFYARPSRMIALEDGSIAVALARLTLDFMRAAEGAVAIVDPATRDVHAIALTGLANCTDVVPVAGDGTRALVACAGDPFTGEAGRRARAGLAIVSSDGVVASWHASEHPEALVAASSPISISGARALAIAMGDLATGQVDRLVQVDLASGSAEVVVEASGAFVLGPGSYDLDSQSLLLPDASTASVRRFRLSSTIEELEPIAASPCRGLPPRELRAL